ncbi:hypothetical protein ACQUFE_18065, partial [Enterococcus casseliflavus]|uniref:hypothetical protein n=1 Tax=Enterococcus casseliflavus TaxID=37734 RepID=UPI003D0EA7F9
QPQAIDLELTKRSDVPSFPSPAPAAPGEQLEVTFPDKDASKPGDLTFAWPANNDLSAKEQMLLEIFLGNIAGDATTPLYKKFVDSKT